MRYLLTILACLSLAACHSTPKRYTPKIASPSAGQVKKSISHSQDSVGRARSSADKLGSNLNKSKDYSYKIEEKTNEILKNWK